MTELEADDEVFLNPEMERRKCRRQDTPMKLPVYRLAENVLAPEGILEEEEEEEDATEVTQAFKDGEEAPVSHHGNQRTTTVNLLDNMQGGSKDSGCSMEEQTPDLSSCLEFQPSDAPAVDPVRLPEALCKCVSDPTPHSKSRGCVIPFKGEVRSPRPGLISRKSTLKRSNAQTSTAIEGCLEKKAWSFSALKDAISGEEEVSSSGWTVEERRRRLRGIVRRDTPMTADTDYALDKGLLRQLHANATPLEEEPLAEEEQELPNQKAGSSAHSKMAAIAESPDQSRDPTLDSSAESSHSMEMPKKTGLSSEEKLRESLRLCNKSNGSARTGMVRPKSGKILVRKNTPALLPRVEKLYAKDKYEANPLCEETEEETESATSKEQPSVSQLSSTATMGLDQAAGGAPK